VFDRFYRDVPREVSGKSISSRHFEPIGTKTCQILIAGHYNGILEADRHYIALASDLGNIDHALRRFQDDRYRQQMVDETYDYVIAEHTYAHRISELIKTVTGTSGVRVSGKSLTSACAAAPGEIETQPTLGRRGTNLSASE
jgi:spore maturation protein CgeB